MVAAAQENLASIKTKVRRLTALSDTSQLTDQDLEERINKFIVTDLPYSIKLDQTQVVYEFFTTPYVDTYPLDIQLYQGIRDPVYVDGYLGSLFKSRAPFYNVWPQTPTFLVAAVGDGSTLDYPSLSLGGSPALPNSIVIGYLNTSNVYIACDDDGVGNIRQVTTGNDGSKTYIDIGTIVYSTGAMNITFLSAPATNANINCSFQNVSPARPYNVLFWNNEFVVRPVPDRVYKVEVMAYKTPAQLLANDASPLIKQWCDYISYGVAIEILTDYQDFESVANLTPIFKQQEVLVMERQATEDIGVANATIYNTPINSYFNNFGGW